MGTAGSVGLLRERIQSTCVVGSGDAVASFDIASLLAAHRKNNAKVTMALWEVDNPSEFGIVGLSSERGGEVNGDLREGFIQRFLEKPSPEEAFSNVINAGLYIIEPEVFEHVPVGQKFDFSKQLFPKLLALGWPMYAQTIDGVWFDVGQPFELIKAQSVLMSRYSELPFAYSPHYTEHDGVLIADSATNKGTVNRSVIGPGCQIEPRATVEDSLLMDNCRIDEGSRVVHSVLGLGVVVPADCVVEDCVIGDGTVLRPAEEYVGKKIEHSP